MPPSLDWSSCSRFSASARFSERIGSLPWRRRCSSRWRKRRLAGEYPRFPVFSGDLRAFGVRPAAPWPGIHDGGHFLRQLSTPNPRRAGADQTIRVGRGDLSRAGAGHRDLGILAYLGPPANDRTDGGPLMNYSRTGLLACLPAAICCIALLPSAAAQDRQLVWSD